MLDKNCTQCRFSIATQIADSQGNPVVGKYQFNCNRLPPSCFMVPTAQGPQMASAFPVVTDEQICSLFIDDETGAALSPIQLGEPPANN